VVLSPGFTKPRATLTGLAEDLASNGYVVATVDHTYENVATTFPDGRVATCIACDGDKDQAFWEKLSAGRANDMSFVLDQLTQPHPTWPGASLIDSSRIAVVGHSAGGASAINALAQDPRLSAGIDIDGTTYGTVPAAGLAQPFLFLGRRDTYSPGSGPEAATWEADWTRLTGWKQWLVVAGAVHESFNDVVVLADQLGIDADSELPGTRSMEITRSYVRAFLDLHLRGKPQPLLEKTSADYPEVEICMPETKVCR